MALRYLCAYCNTESGDAETLRAHVRSHHEPNLHPIVIDINLICERCGKSKQKGQAICSNCFDGLSNKIPEGQGKRDKIRPRHDLIPLEWLDELASICEEGRKPRPGLPEGYGDSWKRGGKDFLIDCLNHASNHLHAYMNGDYSENQLAKVAWNVLAIRFHDLHGKGLQPQKESDAQEIEPNNLHN